MISYEHRGVKALIHAVGHGIGMTAAAPYELDASRELTDIDVRAASVGVLYEYRLRAGLYRALARGPYLVGHLLRRGGISQRELMDIVSVRAGSLSEVLGKLEESGYITRTPNEEDRRRTDLALTPEGEAAARAFDASRKENRETFFSVLSEEEKTQLNALLDKLSAAISWPDENERRRHGHRQCEKHGHKEGRGREGHGAHGHHHHHDHPGHGPHGRGFHKEQEKSEV